MKYFARFVARHLLNVKCDKSRKQGRVN